MKMHFGMKCVEHGVDKATNINKPTNVQPTDVFPNDVKEKRHNEGEAGSKEHYD